MLVQVSDLHLDGAPARHERAERVMAYGLVAVVLLAALLCVPRGRWVDGRAAATPLKHPRR